MGSVINKSKWEINDKKRIYDFFVSEYNFKYKREFELYKESIFYNITIEDNGKDISEYLNSLPFISQGTCVKIGTSGGNGVYYTVCLEKISESIFPNNLPVVEFKKVQHFTLGWKLTSIVSTCMALNHDFNEAFNEVFPEKAINRENKAEKLTKYSKSNYLHKKVCQDRIVKSGLFYSGFNKDIMIPTPLTNQIMEMAKGISEGGKNMMFKTMFILHK